MLEFLDIPHLITHYGYAGVSLIVFLESGIFFALPGDSLLFTAGILASANLISIYKIIPIIFISTFFGSMIGYQIGVYIEKLNRYEFFRKILKPEHLDKAHEFFQRHGKITMLISRFVPIVRTFVPIVAGIAKMKYTEFIKWNLLGSLFWSTIMTMLGYTLGKIIPEILDYTHYFIIGVVAISLFPLFLKRKK